MILKMHIKLKVLTKSIRNICHASAPSFGALNDVFIFHINIPNIILWMISSKRLSFAWKNDSNLDHLQPETDDFPVFTNAHLQPNCHLVNVPVSAPPSIEVTIAMRGWGVGLMQVPPNYLAKECPIRMTLLSCQISTPWSAITFENERVCQNV